MKSGLASPLFSYAEPGETDVEETDAGETDVELE